MKLLKLFKKKKKQVFSDEDYIRSSFIYKYENKNIIILLSFTDNYFLDAIELLSTHSLTTQFIRSSTDIETEELDEDGNHKILSIPKNYLLLGGNIFDYVALINNIECISNPLLTEIIKELYENMNYEYEFKQLIDDGILNKELFRNNYKSNEPYDLSQFNSEFIKEDNIKDIIKKLPSEFNSFHIAKFINIYIKGFGAALTSTIYFDDKTDEFISYIFKDLINNPTRENIKVFYDPLYKRDYDNLSLVNGNISSVDIDQMFQEQYDRFNAINTSDIEYIDIDEPLSEDDPEYNDLQEDKNNE